MALHQCGLNTDHRLDLKLGCSTNILLALMVLEYITLAQVCDRGKGLQAGEAMDFFFEKKILVFISCII